MPIYKYTMFKYMKSASTWVILALTFLMMFMISYLAFNFVHDIDNMTSSIYNSFSKTFFGGVILLIILMGSIFIGFKGAQVYKDEVEDGTFLIVLSKPQNRSKIIGFKWLALFSMTIIFLVILLFSFALSVLIFGKKVIMSGDTNISIYHNLAKDLLIIFPIGLSSLLILSSISLIISTKASTGATIGLTIGIGVAVQITGIVGQFASTKAYNISYLQNDTKNETKNLLGRINSIKPTTTIIQKKQLSFVIASIYTSVISNENTTTPKWGPIPSQKFEGVGLGFTGINLNKKPSFNYLAYMDLSYQTALLGNIATSVTTPDNSISNGNAINAASKNNAPGSIKKQVFVSTYTPTTFKNSVWNKMIANIENANGLIDRILGISMLNPIKPWIQPTFFINLNNLIEASKDVNITPKIVPKTDPNIIIENIFNKLVENNKVDKIKYVDFINKYGILTAYILIAIILIPSSYYLLRKQDFR